MLEMAIKADRESEATRKMFHWGEGRDRIEGIGKWAEVW